ncbi:MAG: hypothetical protein AAF558_12510 [Verrucomicrobiota bacterium]
MNATSSSPSVNPWLPPLVIFLLLGHLLLMMIRPEYPLGDPGTPWHFKWGQVLVEDKVLYRYDFFSHTLDGKEWVNYQWLFQVFVGITQAIGAIPFTTAVLMLIYGCIPVLLCQRIMKEGCHAGLALGFSALGWFVLTMHSLARPHIFTYLFFGILLERLYRIYEGKATLRSSWWLVPMMMVWTNFHGGFSVGLFLIGVVFWVALPRWFLNKTPEHWAVVKELFWVGFACGMVSLINPYGWNLHFHILKFLELKCLANWEEFASPDFYSPSGNIRGYELMILGVLSVFFWCGKSKRLNELDFVLILVFLHFSLQSTRHVNLFVLVAAPVLARGFDELLRKKEDWYIVKRGHEMSRDQLLLKGGRIFFPLIVIGYLWLSFKGEPFFEEDFYDQNLSLESAEFIEEHRDRIKRPFNTDNVGGALIYYFGPDLKVFFDDRADFYWQEFVTDVYFPVRFAKEEWSKILEEYQVDTLILPKKNPLNPLLNVTPVWQVVHEDDLNIIYFKTD